MEKKIMATENKPNYHDGGGQCRTVSANPALAIEGRTRSAQTSSEEFAAATKSAASLRSSATKRPRGNRELLRLCHEFNRLERIALDRWDDDNFDWADLLKRQRILSLEISAIQPETVEDYRAIVRAIVGWRRGVPPEDIDDMTERNSHLLTFLMRSLVGIPHRKARNFHFA